MRWLAIFLTIAAPALAEDGQGPHFVKADRVKVRLCPATTCPATNSLTRGQAVQVFEIKTGWARVSKYYDATAQRQEFPEITTDTVANWIRIDMLSRERPVEEASTKIDGGRAESTDPRITGIPSKPAFGLTSTDIAILRKFATKLLQSGQCSEVDDGDKSLSKTGQYYVHCTGEPSNRFFSATDSD